MARRRVAVVQSTIISGGGTEAVTAWTMEALKEEYQLSLLTFSRVDAGLLNRFYGTELAADDFSIIRPRLSSLLSRTYRLSILKDHLMMRYCKSARDDVDLFISVGSGMDFGRRGIQYVAYAPASTFVKVLTRDRSMSGRYYFFKKSFMGLCESISRFSEDSLKGNITLATSKWTGKLIQEMYAVNDYEVVFPPVEAQSSSTPWPMRKEGFLCVARIVPEKLVHEAIEILMLVRQKGFDVSLHIVGRGDDANYLRKVNQLAEEHSSWVFVHGVLAKKELFSLMDQNKYGINAAQGEPSGVAALEMVKAGCILFMRNGGGLPEIVDTAELTYDGVDDGVRKITAVLSDESIQQGLCTRLEGKAETFSTENFCNALRRIVRDFFNGQ